MVSSPGFSVKEITVFYLCFQHFFEAESLSTELNFIATVNFRSSALEFNGDNLFRTVFAGNEFHNVSMPRKPKPKGVEPERSHGFAISPVFRLFFMNLLMQVSSFNRQDIFFPSLFQVNQSPLPFTESEMLQSRNWKKVIFCEHFFNPSRIHRNKSYCFINGFPV